MIEKKKQLNILVFLFQPLVAMETERDWVVNCRKNIEMFPIQHKVMQNCTQIEWVLPLAVREVKTSVDERLVSF